jgi:membrane protein
MDEQRSIHPRRPAAPRGGDDRGRYAEKPSDIKWPGWKDIFWRVWNELGRDRISMVSASVAFYATLAVFPALAAAVSIYGLVADPQTIQNQLNTVAGVMPQDAFGVISNQLQALVQAPRAGLSLTLIGSLLVTLWSANNGMKALIEALNIVYNEEEKRGFFKLNLVSLGFTLAAILFSLVALSLVVAVPAFIGTIEQAFGGLRTPVVLLRWVPLAALIVLGLAVAYRYAPSRRAPHWRWVTWGSTAATVLWLAASMLFSYYVSNFGSYNKMYGSVAAVVILMMWFYITAFIALLGAEVDSEMEHQTVQDTTVGGEKPMGRREAYMADTVGEERPEKK